MIRLAALVRGLVQRGGTTLLILAVALVAAAAAAAGPVYYQAARDSIMHDAIARASFIGRGYEATETGSVNGTLRQLIPAARGRLALYLGGLARRDLFAPPVYAIETNELFPEFRGTVPVVWRSGFCAQLRFRGSCPAAPGQVLASSVLAAQAGWHIGQRLSFPGWKPLTITGLYRLPDASKPYWFGRGASYFPVGSPLDALFTPRATMERLPGTQQGTTVIDDLLRNPRLQPRDVTALSSAMTSFSNDPGLQAVQILVSSGIPVTLQGVLASWRTMAIPVVLITAQLIAACLLLLFLAVTDAIDARGQEIALAKLRGRGGWRTLVFGMSEPVLLLLLAWPAGTLLGWAATAALSRALLRNGTSVGLPPLAWAAAGAATLGGVVAVLLAARRTLRRPVLEEWRRSSRRPEGRGWVLDAVLATGAAAGLLELSVTGEIGSARRGALGLLVPGLLGLAIAVIASRLLPLACRAGFARTRRRGSIGVFLALRHVARRPGGVRTMMVLATAFALAAFAVTAWAVGRNNEQAVAAAQVGAPTVLTVSVPPGRDLSAAVARADPSGRMAAAVDRFTSFASGSAGLTTLAVDPQRFAQVAGWRASYARAPLGALMRRIDPPAPAPVVLTGDAVRITVAVHHLAPAGALLSADVTTGASPVSLGTLPARGTVTRTGPLVGCPCVLNDLDLGPPANSLQNPVTGSVTITALQVHHAGGWVSLTPGALTSAAHWRAGRADVPPDRITGTSSGLDWRFSGRPEQDALLVSVNRPYPVPAVVARSMLGSGTGVVTGVGLDGRPLQLRVVSGATVVPGAPQSGVIVDRRYAELAAGEDFPQVQTQVWLASGAPPAIARLLAAQGIRVVSASTAATVVARYARQGPALASVLFLADAAAAALLAAGAAVLGLYLSARRRRYEYAALSASGVPLRTLRRAVLTEMGLVLGFGVVVGIGAGLAAALLALRSVPEFVATPAAPPLSYVPPAGPLVLLLGLAVLLLGVVAVTASTLLIRGVRLEQLREAPA